MDLEVFSGRSPFDSSDNCSSSAKSKHCAEGSDFGCSSLESSGVSGFAFDSSPSGRSSFTFLDNLMSKLGHSQLTC